MLKKLYAKRVEKLADPTVRDTLAVAARPNIISLSGGIPNPSLFPEQDFVEAINHIADTQLSTALQYSVTAGLPVLRKSIARYLGEKWGKYLDESNVLITTGSQQALDLLGRVSINAGDTIAVGNPTYFVAMGAFNAYDPVYASFNLESDGPDMDNLASILANKIKPKFIYTVPTFQNPSGITWSEEKRKQLLSLATKNDVLIVEDDPYGELYFEAAPPKAITALDKTGQSVYLGTFSKTLAPGLRIGYIIGDPKLIETLILVKQSMDLHSPTLSQLIIAYLLDKPSFYENHLSSLRKYYRQQNTYMMNALSNHLPSDASWTTPSGGLFTWVEIKNINTKTLLPQVVEKGMAFMPGYPFFANEENLEVLRLTFATATKEQIEEGVRILGECITNAPKKTQFVYNPS